MQDFHLTGNIRYVGNVEIENLIADTRVRQGLVHMGGNVTNPLLVKEAMRPSIITQHLEYIIKLR